MVSSCALPLTHSCVLILLNGHILCQHYMGEVVGRDKEMQQRKISTATFGVFGICTVEREIVPKM